MITPTEGRFLAKRLKEKKKPGDLLIHSHKPLYIFRIVAACEHEHLKSGDIIAVTSHGGMPFEYEDKNYFFFREEHILGTIQDLDQYEDENV